MKKQIPGILIKSAVMAYAVIWFCCLVKIIKEWPR